MEAIIKSRIDADLKTEVETVLAALGMTVSDVMRITFAQIAARKGLPFDVKLPNAQTESALRESGSVLNALRAGAKPRFESLDAYFATMEQGAEQTVDASKAKPMTAKAVKRTAAPK